MGLGLCLWAASRHGHLSAPCALPQALPCSGECPRPCPGPCCTRPGSRDGSSLCCRQSTARLGSGAVAHPLYQPLSSAQAFLPLALLLLLVLSPWRCFSITAKILASPSCRSSSGLSVALSLFEESQLPSSISKTHLKMLFTWQTGKLLYLPWIEVLLLKFPWLDLIPSPINGSVPLVQDHDYGVVWNCYTQLCHALFQNFALWSHLDLIFPLTLPFIHVFSPGDIAAKDKSPFLFGKSILMCVG